jgi:hypothetical protein
MRRSYFGPMLFLGIMSLLAGCAGMFDNFRKMKATDIALESFIDRYQNGNDYNALFKEAVTIYKEANFLRSEYTAFPASCAVIGVFITLFAFDRRRMFEKCKELKHQLED